MRIKLLLIIFFLTALPTIYAQNSGKEYLKKVLTKLEKVESATYNSLMKAGSMAIQQHCPSCMDSLKNTIIPWTRP